jgi:hypothetical protein
LATGSFKRLAQLDRCPLQVTVQTCGKVKRGLLRACELLAADVGEREQLRGGVLQDGLVAEQRLALQVAGHGLQLLGREPGLAARGLEAGLDLGDGFGLHLEGTHRRGPHDSERRGEADGQRLAQRLGVLAEVLELALCLAQLFVELLGVGSYTNYEVA